MHLNNKSNKHVKELGLLFDQCPKAVLAALAVSFASVARPGDADQALATEWVQLHAEGVIPQPPSRHARTLAGEDDPGAEARAKKAEAKAIAQRRHSEAISRELNARR